MSVVREEPWKRHFVKLHFAALRLAWVEHADEVAVEAAPPQAAAGVRYAAAHAAAETAYAARLGGDIVVGELAGLGIDAPNVSAGPACTVEIVLRIRSDVIC